MNKLKCEEKSCRHNCNLYCDKKSIVLDDDAVCCSYQRKTIDSMSEEFSNEKTPEYADLETTINCNENSCYFNMNNLCKASEVTIDSDAWCSTYRKR